MVQRQLVLQPDRDLQRQADADSHLIGLWLHGRSRHTQRAYRSSVSRFRGFAEKPIRSVTLGDLQRFADSLAELTPSSRSRILSDVKSLLAFGHRTGYLTFDVGRALRLPSQKDTLGERILSEADVLRMIASEPNERNRVLLLLLYGAGLRVSELCSLKCPDLQERGDAGQVTVLGKGSKTRTVLLSKSVWKELSALTALRGMDAAVFVSQKGGALSASQVQRVVKDAARRAGLSWDVSPHWLRHAHASHALDRGAPIHLVQATLGHTSVATTGRYLHARPNDSSGQYLAV